MAEHISFHFEGALADSHRMNFYESARFQYAAARLMVKLAQFRRYGKFVKNITNASNIDIQLATHSDGSFNINVEDTTATSASEYFVDMSLADLLAYISERLIEKIDESTLSVINDSSGDSQLPGRGATAALDRMVKEAIANGSAPESLSSAVQALIKRRVAENYREGRMADNETQISRIDFARSQKLIAMSAPLISEMAVALRNSADTLEINALRDGRARSVLFLDRRMAQDIETATVDNEITPLLGDIAQFNKDNGWGKLKIENGAKILSFNIPYDILQTIKQKLIDNMKKDLVHLQTYFVRDRGGDVVRLIVVGILPTPTI